MGENYQVRQRQRDEEYVADHRRWMASLSPPERRRVESMSLGAPLLDINGCGVGMDEDVANGASVESHLVEDLIAGEHEENAAPVVVRQTMMELAILVRTQGLQDAAELLQERVNDIKVEARRVTFNALLAFVWTQLPAADDKAVCAQVRMVNPWMAFKRFLAITRRVNASLINGVSQTEVAMLLGETRASVSAREKFVENFLKSCGAKGFLGTGGVKSVSSRKVFADAQKGNHNRRRGTRKKKVSEFLAKDEG